MHYHSVITRNTLYNIMSRFIKYIGILLYQMITWTVYLCRQYPQETHNSMSLFRKRSTYQHMDQDSRDLHVKIYV